MNKNEIETKLFETCETHWEDCSKCPLLELCNKYVHNKFEELESEE